MPIINSGNEFELTRVSSKLWLDWKIMAQKCTSIFSLQGKDCPAQGCPTRGPRAALRPA